MCFAEAPFVTWGAFATLSLPSLAFSTGPGLAKPLVQVVQLLMFVSMHETGLAPIRLCLPSA